jgi:ketosteroid isomerase-like protein
MGSAEENKDLVRRFWADLYAKDFAAVGAYFAPDGHYVDVCAGEEGAYGPEQIERRLRLGIEPITGYHHRQKLMVAEGDVVVTEHSEEWHWDTGESVVLPFVSVHEIRDGKIVRWWDYWDLQTLLGAAPQWWIDRIMVGYQ